MLIRLLVIAFSLMLVFPSPGYSQTAKVWTIEETLDARQTPVKKERIRYCQGTRFKPCVCAKDVSKLLQYRPALKECGGKAALIGSGKYKDVFSMVVRDDSNRDRFPENTNYGGCSAQERDVLALARCSAFKVQDRFTVEHPDGDADVHCLGESGYSPLFKKVVRATAKLSDVPGTTNDPLARWCLRGPGVALN